MTSGIIGVTSGWNPRDRVRRREPPSAAAAGLRVAFHERSEAPVDSGLEIDRPRPLFALRDSVAVGISSDGSRVAAVYPQESETASRADVIDLVVNWDAGTSKRPD